MRVLAFAASFLVGCIGGGPPTPSADNTSCGSLAPNVALRAVDAADGMTLPFSVAVNAQSLVTADCEPGNTRGDTPCAGTLSFVLFDAADVTVSADGYADATLHLDGGRVGEACAAPAYSFDLWVPLHRR